MSTSIGEPLKRYPLEYDRTTSLQSVHLLHYALRAVSARGYWDGRLSLPAGKILLWRGKPEPSNDGRDSWFAGFSGDLLAVSWIGRDDNGGTGLTGGSGALKVWGHFMARASRQLTGVPHA